VRGWTTKEVTIDLLGTDQWRAAQRHIDENEVRVIGHRLMFQYAEQLDRIITPTEKLMTS